MDTTCSSAASLCLVALATQADLTWPAGSRGRVRGADQKCTGLGAEATLPRPQLGFQWLLDSTKSRIDAQQDKSKADHLLVPSPTATWVPCPINCRFHSSQPLFLLPVASGLPVHSSDPESSPALSQGRKSSPVENSQQGGNLIAALHPQWPARSSTGSSYRISDSCRQEQYGPLQHAAASRPIPLVAQFLPLCVALRLTLSYICP